jgi:hypothetical protein
MDAPCDVMIPFACEIVDPKEDYILSGFVMYVGYTQARLGSNPMTVPCVKWLAVCTVGGCLTNALSMVAPTLVRESKSMPKNSGSSA